MPIPTQLFLGSRLRLTIAITLFVVLDLSVLVINLWIAERVAEDAVAINLAGRQRMLSQRITKSLLLVHHAQDPTTRGNARKELGEAFRLFESTLRAFDQGGAATGGDGKPATLRRVEADSGRKPLVAALHLLEPVIPPLRALLESSTDQMPDRQAMDYMVAHNQEILARMNQLTTALEQSSVQRTKELRMIQTGAFVLAMANFLIIVLGLVKQYHHVEKDGQRWREIAQRDPLTGLYNRVALREALGAALEEAERCDGALSILMLDLDGFKPINDQFGHATGDQLLIHLAETLRNLARESDAVARLGGDEFALLCPNLRGEDAIDHFCTRVLDGIAGIECMQNRQRPVRASIGVSRYPDHGTGVDDLLAAADRAMYQSKRAGGNRWTLAEVNR
jgi:diguanylate cyclase (GGDEF)-like protein